MTFQHGCPHHYIPPGEIYFFIYSNSAKNKKLFRKSAYWVADYDGNTPETLMDISRRQWFAIECAVKFIGVEV